MRTSLLAAAVSLILPGAAGAATVDISSCPTTVPNGAVGVVQADLQCDAGPTSAISLGRGATLDLNGHTIELQPASGAVGTIVGCEKRCTVLGPGALVGLAGPPLVFAGIFVEEGGRATVHDVDVAGVANGIVAFNGKLRIRDSGIDAVQWGLSGVTLADLTSVDVQVAEPGGYCVGATDETGSVVRGSDVTLSGCPDGIWASKKVSLTGLTATGLGGIAVFSGKVIRLRDSTVTGSGNLDLLSGRRPNLKNTVCDRSGVADDDVPSESWGVCANDP